MHISTRSARRYVVSPFQTCRRLVVVAVASCDVGEENEIIAAAPTAPAVVRCRLPPAGGNFLDQIAGHQEAHEPVEEQPVVISRGYLLYLLVKDAVGANDTETGRDDAVQASRGEDERVFAVILAQGEDAATNAAAVVAGQRGAHGAPGVRNNCGGVVPAAALLHGSPRRKIVHI